MPLEAQWQDVVVRWLFLNFFGSWGLEMRPGTCPCLTRSAVGRTAVATVK